MDAVPYDFTKPGRFTPQMHGVLTAWLRAAFALGGKTWAKELPAPLEATLEHLDVSYAKNAFGALTEGLVGYRVMIDAERVRGFLILPRVMLLQLVGVLLGEREAKTEDRELTVIEENLADFFLTKYWLPFFRETWPKNDLVTWTLQERHANPQASRLFAPRDTLVTVKWKLRGPWGEGEGYWFFKRPGLCAALGDDDDATRTATPEIVHKRRDLAVKSLPLAIEVVLGSAEVRLSQLSQLQAGDVVILDQRTDEKVIAQSGGRELFRGTAGRVGSWKAFQIESFDKE